MSTEFAYLPGAAEDTLSAQAVGAGRVGRSRLARAALLADAAAVLLVAAAILALGAIGMAEATSLAITVLLVGATLPIAFGIAGLYRVDPIDHSALNDARDAAVALACLGFVWFVGALVVAPGVVGRGEGLLGLLGLPILFGFALMLRTRARQAAMRAHPERVLIVGAGRTGQDVARRLVQGRSGTISVVGFVDDDPMEFSGDDLDGVPIYRESDGIAAAVAATGATRLVLAFTRRRPEEVLDSLRGSRAGSLPTAVVPRLHEITPAHAGLSDLAGVPVVNLTGTRLSTTAQVAKRTLDIGLAGIGLIVLSPVLLAIAAAVRFESPGPIFFRQSRRGIHGSTFRIFKFRTMHRDAEAARLSMAHLNEMANPGPLFKMQNDPRVTSVGSFLRRTSLDEIPQLFNVIRGDMSLVGPRPFVVHEADQITGWGERRLDLLPGITGLWQARGRNDVAYEEMVRLDYMYVTNWSLWWDIRIIFQTIPTVLRGTGAR